MQQYQTQQFDFSSTIQSNKNMVRSFEKLTNLIVLICYKKRSWLNKFSSHNLFNNLVKMLKVACLFSFYVIYDFLLLSIELKLNIEQFQFDRIDHSTRLVDIRCAYKHNSFANA